MLLGSLARKGTAALVALAGTLAGAAYGETQRVPMEAPVPGGWVVLGFLDGDLDWETQPLGMLLLDTRGAPSGTLLRIHPASPIPPGWEVRPPVWPHQVSHRVTILNRTGPLS